MKLASLKSGRDGRLIVVSRDNEWATDASDVYATMQSALDDWKDAEPKLREKYDRLNRSEGSRFPFDETACSSPLPRAFQWADGSAYVNHVELVRKARNATMPDSFWTDPLMYQGGSDTFLSPRGDIPAGDEAWGIDFEGEIAVIVDDVPAGAGREIAARAIKLVMLVNDVSLRNLIPQEIGKGFGFFQSKPASAFSPIAVTPDELGTDWDGARLHLPLLSYVNGSQFGKPNAGKEMTFDFPDLISHAARTRALVAGTIIGSGTVSNRDNHGGPGKPIQDGGAGYSCISEIRMVETILQGEPKTPYLRDGDVVRIEMLDPKQHSIFGRIEQTVVVTQAR
ncbi:fumarylacetoacetate hydrolase family protein [Rhizobium sp. Rhizsp42]|uniref:fumarylacetoacetate hydrolase family protein n=1 Tax=Rhizobium sp. Rhizsp42 TaxID=3243034 RepID=UPI0039AFCB53